MDELIQPYRASARCREFVEGWGKREAEQRAKVALRKMKHERGPLPNLSLDLWPLPRRTYSGGDVRGFVRQAHDEFSDGEKIDPSRNVQFDSDHFAEEEGAGVFPTYAAISDRQT